MRPHKYREELHNLLQRLKQERLDTQKRVESRKYLAENQNYLDAVSPVAATRMPNVA